MTPWPGLSSLSVVEGACISSLGFTPVFSRSRLRDSSFVSPLRTPFPLRYYSCCAFNSGVLFVLTVRPKTNFVKISGLVPPPPRQVLPNINQDMGTTLKFTLIMFEQSLVNSGLSRIFYRVCAQVPHLCMQKLSRVYKRLPRH
jgi:hypothetical protein